MIQEDEIQKVSRLGHNQVPIQFEDLVAEVDEDLAPLIEAIWRKNFRTQWSCQDTSWEKRRVRVRNHAYIVFTYYEDACNFVLETSQKLHEITNEFHRGQRYEEMHLEPFNPPFDDLSGIRGVVPWPTYLTRVITEAWTE